MSAPPATKLRACCLAAICLAGALTGCGGGSQPEDNTAGPPRSAISGPLPDKGNLLFVMRGSANVIEDERRPRADTRAAKRTVAKRDPKADARLAGLHDRIELKADAVEWFTDRPQRKAGIAAAHEFVDRWKGYGFDEQPPNAAVTGPGTDAVVELRKPQKTPDGAAFEAVGIRGELPPKQHENLSLFIDSSEWKTDQHVYMSNLHFCQEYKPEGDGSLILTNPQIITAPHNWSVAPPQSFTVPDNLQDYQVFNAASTSGTTSYEVKYDVSCDGYSTNTYPQGEVTLKGKVPDSWSSNSFSCSTADMPHGQCGTSYGGGYHASAYAQLQGD